MQGQESADLWGWLSVSARGWGTRHLDCLAPLPLRLREGRWSGRSSDEQEGSECRAVKRSRVRVRLSAAGTLRSCWGRWPLAAPPRCTLPSRCSSLGLAPSGSGGIAERFTAAYCLCGGAVFRVAFTSVTIVLRARARNHNGSGVS